MCVEYCDDLVCLYVCLSVHMHTVTYHITKLYQIFCAHYI